MDDPTGDPHLVARTLSDVAMANKLFGGSRAVLKELGSVAERGTRNVSILDIGTGIGDIPAAAAETALANGVSIDAVGIDASEAAMRIVRGRNRGPVPVVANALALPFRDKSFDVAMCSQVLHHFLDTDAVILVREMNRVARTRVIISDIRRSWFAAVGIWVASFPLRFHPVSRHDGCVSVLRGYTADELRSLIYGGIGITPRVTARAGFRLTASWNPSTFESLA